MEPNPSRPLTSRSDHARLLYLALAVGAIAALVSILLLWMSGFFGGNRALPPEVLLLPDTYPPHAVQKAAGEAVEPLTVEGQGTAVLYGHARTETHAYYLLSGPGANQSTLYRTDLANPAAGLEQLTNSESLKIELSLNGPAGVAAYTARGETGESRVVALDLRTRTETDLGLGAHPRVLADGSVLFERAGVLLTTEVGSGTEREVLRIGNETIYAVDPSIAQIAVYDRPANAVTFHWIERAEDQVESALAGTTSLAEAPHALFYKNGELFAARTGVDTLYVYTLDGERENILSAPGLSLDAFTLTAL